MDILIDELDGSLWVAAVEKGKLEDLELDPENEEVRWGSIYWGKVLRIDKAMDAAIVQLDIDNTGILHNADVRIKPKRGPVKKGGGEAIGKLLKPGQMIAVQAKSGYIPTEDDGYNQPLESAKMPKLSMDITLPGRYLIRAPLMQTNRISNRIRDKKLRRQLNKMLDSIEHMNGCILRAAAANTQTDILMREGNILNSIWERLQEYFEGDEPQLIMLGPDAIQRTMSDNAHMTINRIDIVTMEQFENVEEWCEIYAPDLVTKITPVEMDNPYENLALFDFRDIFGQVEELFHPYAVLNSGANLIIQETAALCAIDINRGTHKGSNLDINVEAAREIGRQLRLRNLGGIIIVDFLKMKTKREEGILIAAMEDVFSDDPCTTQIHGITALGLMEITRKRRTPALLEYFSGSFEDI